MQLQPGSANGALPVYTVAVVDLVGYSSLARILEENTGAGSITELNRRIQALIREAFSSPTSLTHIFVSETGDGAILLFESAEQAHQFSERIHHLSEKHNLSRTEKSALRSFRVGLATGEVSCVEGPDGKRSFAGITIANAVRFETAAKPGEIIIDLPTFDRLPIEMQSPYSAERIVRGKRDESFRVRRYRVVSKPTKFRMPQTQISRRKMIMIAAGVSGGTLIGFWAKGIDLDRFLYPLPSRRFVALQVWPKPEAEMEGVGHSIVSSIWQRLARAESGEKDFLVMTFDDPLLEKTSTQPQSPAEAASFLGANLALAAALRTTTTHLHLTLQLSDASSGRTLRHRTLSTTLAMISGIGQIAASEAAKLLDLHSGDRVMADDDEVASMPAAAFHLFSDGRRLWQEANDVHLDDGIEKLQELVNDYPRIAIGYAELAQAYMRKYLNEKDDAVLKLASANATRALQLNPDSSRALLGMAQVDLYTGKPDEGLRRTQQILDKDPMNPDVLLYRGRMFQRLGKPAEEEQVYRQIIVNRPNYWPAYNELGAALQSQARYPEAIQAFTTASRIAPKVSWPLSMLGILYLQAGDQAKAKQTLEQSLAISPNEIAYRGLGDLAFEEGKYSQALSSFQSAKALDPNSHAILRDIADCYTMLGQPDQARASFQQAAQLLSKLLPPNSKNGDSWMLLAFYHAKIGDFTKAANEMKTAAESGGTDLQSLFLKAQILATMGKNDEALQALLLCIDKGLSQADVDLAVDLKNLRRDPRYLSRIAKK